MSRDLKQYYLEDRKLAQLAWLEFVRAMRTGRVIAFVGSMATEAFGYGSWKQLKDIFVNAAEEMLESMERSVPRAQKPAFQKQRSWAKEKIDEIVAAMGSGRLKDPVALSLIEEVFDHDKLRQYGFAGFRTSWPLDLTGRPSESLAQRFAEAYREPTKARLIPAGKSIDDVDVPKLLFDDLDIRRFATTNYDFEIERKTMLRDQPRTASKPGSPFRQLAALRSANLQSGTEVFSWDLGGGRIRRVLTHGKASESDLLNRERIDRLIEFAVGADDVDSHVMHMHGRACDPRGMIVTQRDYDRLYRRNDLNRLPFEFAKRLMTGGNPILFVGLGMSEEDLNRELREFISNKPYQRSAPAFLLWSAAPEALDPVERHIKRLDFLHRLGVLTIFDTDLNDPEALAQYEVAKAAREAKASAEGVDVAKVKGPFIKPEEELGSLAVATAAIARKLSVGLREDNRFSRWRDTSLILQVHEANTPYRLWQTVPPDGIGSHVHPDVAELLTQAKGHRLLCALGPAGCGKGQAAAGLAAELAKTDPCLLINGGFSFDTDSMLNGISHFLTLELEMREPDESRSEFFRRLRSNTVGQPVYIVLNGGERFFSITGRPLSAELDELMRLGAPRIRWVLFGTERIKQYACDEVGFAEHRLSSTLASIPFDYMQGLVDHLGSKKTDPATLAPGDWRNLQAESRRYRAFASGRISGDSLDLRRAFYSWALDNDVLARFLGTAPAGIASSDVVKLAQQVLRTLAFIGLPVECAVLVKAPALNGHPLIKQTLERLHKCGLVVELTGFPGYRASGAPPRYALHRSLMTELRYRFGIPLSEAKLSTAFNMSLYVAQPVDGYIPEPDIHDELGTLTDRLIGAYRDEDGATLADVLARYNKGLTSPKPDQKALESILQEVSRASMACAEHAEVSEMLRAHRVCTAESVQWLRAALAVIRGYYSTTGILTLDSSDRLVSDDRDGILDEHAQRLDRLIDAHAKVSLAREALRAGMLSTWGKAGEEIFGREYGTVEALYPDELVWLHNERGVVCLAMGDLYEARAAFERAMDVNRSSVEHNDRAHNWRRIRLNQLSVELEMGNLSLARRIADEIISVSKTKPDPVTGEKPCDEDRRAVAIATGHLAWARHLQGEYGQAQNLYHKAIRMLEALEETRAQAYFARLQVDALGNSTPESRRHLERALDLAQSTRQMDLVYRFQVTQADAYFFSPDSDARKRQRANRLLEEALQYALQTDVHRVRCEASMTIARIRFETGDYEGALRFASDALMVATRYGMELRKITLRTDVARIMAARGHPVTAQKLASVAVNIASRQRFQTAIDRGERVLLEIPNLSAAIGSSDHSGRRSF